MSATILAREFRRAARALEMVPAAGGAAVPILGRLRRPSEAELIGGLSQGARVFVCVAADLEAAGFVPASYDRVRDPESGQSFTIQFGETAHWAADPVWYRAEVMGG